MIASKPIVERNDRQNFTMMTNDLYDECIIIKHKDGDAATHVLNMPTLLKQSPNNSP